MRKRGLLQGVIALALGAAVAVMPAIAGSETTPPIEAQNEAYGYFHWHPNAATVGPGGSVPIVNKTAVSHGVEWKTGPETPACKGVPVGSSGAGWEGSCIFAKPGVYEFWCTVHGSAMAATVTVTAGETTTSSTGISSTGTTSTTSYSGTSTSRAPPPPGASPLQGSAREALTLARSQKGTRVRGSIRVSPAGAGGRLEVKLLAKRASLAGAGGPFRAPVGKTVRRVPSAGKLSFSAALNARGRSALRRRGRLALRVLVRVSSPASATFSASRSVLLHRR